MALPFLVHLALRDRQRALAGFLAYPPAVEAGGRVDGPLLARHLPEFNDVLRHEQMFALLSRPVELESMLEWIPRRDAQEDHRSV